MLDKDCFGVVGEGASLGFRSVGSSKGFSGSGLGSSSIVGSVSLVAWSTASGAVEYSLPPRAVSRGSREATGRLKGRSIAMGITAGMSSASF